MKAQARRRFLVTIGEAGGAGAAVALLACTARLATAQAPREIEVVAERFRFTPNEITLKAGEPVVLLLRTLDFEHGFSVPDLGLRCDFVPGRVVRVDVVTHAPGTLPFLCDNFCGEDHEGMSGRIIVNA